MTDYDIWYSLCSAFEFSDNNRTKAIEILKSKWDIINPNYINEYYPDCKSGILHIASMENNYKLIELVLSHPKTDPNLLDSIGRSPISCANSLESLNCSYRHN